MDMARTFTNVFGNCLASTVMAKIEGEFRTEAWEREMKHREMQESVRHEKLSAVPSVH